jgi:aryl-alcohol dehydrogenase-like predicted oxidoreductase
VKAEDKGGFVLSRNLGQSGISVSAIGLGCMGLSEFYAEPTPEAEAIDLLHRAVDLGITHFDTAEIYGLGRNEQLLGKAFAGRWDRIVLATKFGPQRDPGHADRGYRGRDGEAGSGGQDWGGRPVGGVSEDY